MTDQEARDELRRIMAEQGFDVEGATPHGWRCEHPDRYPGYCTCVGDMIDAVLAAGYRKHPEPEWEWEYGTALRTADGSLWDFEPDSKPHAFAHVAECDVSDHSDGESCVVVRRPVTRGPWELVA